jgi:TRAP-type C4-dicarboxylate transport system permease small subunit
MIRSEYVLNKATGRLSNFLEIFACILGIIFFGLIAYSTFEPTINAYIRNEFEGHASFRFPTFPVRASIFLCSIFAAFTYFLKIMIILIPEKTKLKKDQ